jgi:putative oxidoreductase
MRRYSLDIGRILLSIIFLGSAATKIADPAGTQAYMAAFGLPMPGVLLVGAIATEVVGGLALLLGLKARRAALVLTGFLAVATLVFHTDLGDQQQLLHFLKNLAIIGGLVLVMAEGTGPLSLGRQEEPPTRGTAAPAGEGT